MHEKGYSEVIGKNPRFKYKIGIIDFLTTFNNIKILENRGKALLYGVDRNTISAINPNDY